MKKQKSFRRAFTLSDGIDKSFPATKKKVASVYQWQPIISPQSLIPLALPNRNTEYRTNIDQLHKKSKKKILKETLLSSPTYSSHWQLSTIHIHTHMNTVKLNPVEKSSRGFSCHIFCQLLGNAILCGEKSISARWHSLKMAHFWWGRRRGESFSWIYRHFRTWKQRLKEIGTLMHRLFLRRLPSKSNAFEVVQPLQYSNSQLSATLPGRMADEEKWSNWKKKRSSSAFLLCPTL